MSEFIIITKESFDLILKNSKHYLDNTSTTKLLSYGLLVISSSYMLKNWIKQLIYWKYSELDGPMPLPLVGNLNLVMKKGINEFNTYLVNKYGKTAIYFIGPNTIPTIATVDRELIKVFTIRDFQYFRNRKSFPGIDQIEIMNNFLTNLRDDSWKNLRSVMSTGFTSGKLKKMTGTVLEVCESFDEHLESLAANCDDLDTKNMFSRFALDVICSCFFGYSTNVINQPDSEIGKRIQTVFAKIKNPSMALIVLFPKFASYLMKKKWLQPLDPMVIDFLKELANHIINERKLGKTRRNDFIQTMVDHSEEKNEDNQNKRTVTDEEVLSNSLLFMLAGTETTASALGYICFNLTKHQDVQTKLIEEIDSVLEKYNGVICYEAVNEMEYLSKVINETQRQYPISQFDREASQDIEINGIKVLKGQLVTALVNAVHSDENIYSQSEKFLPERETQSDAFFPFGNGPRNCIAMRFALLEMKLVLTKILTKYRLENCEKTIDKMELDGFGRPKNTIYLKVVKRIKE